MSIAPDVLEFFTAAREKFPSVSARTDAIHIERLRDENLEFPFLWFENMAEVLNEDMREGVPYRDHAALFIFLTQQLGSGSDKVREYIDVAVVENLFWKVSADQARPWWRETPAALKQLYVGFHQRPPC